MSQHFVIIGGGQAGAMAAASLRQKGFNGQLTLIGDEPNLPYERPPLSKAMLLDETPQLSSILPTTWWQENQVTVLTQCQATQLDAQQQWLSLSNGETLHFDKLLIATGARARRLPLLDALDDRAHTLRNARDAQKLRSYLQNKERLIIVGAGTIGLEVAASAKQCGCDVCVVEAAPMLMGRNTPKPVQDYLLHYHQQQGIQFYFNTQIEMAVLEDELTLTLQNGQCLTADRIIYGIGIEPNDELAVNAGLATQHGIIVDEHCQTSHPNIYAAGDVTLCKNAEGALIRKETWENANHQADIAASTMLGLNVAEKGAPWFWSDQYDLNLQFIGDIKGQHWLVRGDPATKKAIWLNIVDQQLIGAITLNQGREIRVLRKLIDSGKHIDPHALTDTKVVLKTLL